MGESRNNWWLRLAWIGALLALLGECLPTWTLTWAPDPDTVTSTRHSWFDPVLLGYAQFLAPLSLFCTVVILTALTVHLVRCYAHRWPGVLALAVALVLAVGGYPFGRLAGVGLLVPPLLLVTGLAVLRRTANPTD